MGCSALFHLMYVRSESTQNVLSRLDYGGIAVLIYGSCIPIIYYCFGCSDTKSKCRLLWVTLLAVQVIVVSVMGIMCVVCFTVTLMPKFD
jgi:predicted membrane channel-forming protein YqfA (hemolysin III family)